MTGKQNDPSPSADPTASSLDEPTPPAAPEPTPPPVPTSVSAGESHSGLTSEVKALAGLVSANLQHARQESDQTREQLATIMEDWRAAQEIMEQRIADLTALAERHEEALAAHIRLIESQANRR